MAQLLTSADRPDGWVYPLGFIRVAEHDLLDLEPVDRVMVVHDFSSVNRERQAFFKDVHAWLRLAFEDFVEWGELEEQQSYR